MSHASAAAPLIEWEAHYKAKVIEATWGHLAPEKGKTYRGYMIFCTSAYGDVVVIDSKFNGLDDSPWLYEAMTDFVSENSESDGRVYRFDGTFRNYEFKGSIKEISCK